MTKHLINHEIKEKLFACHYKGNGDAIKSQFLCRKQDGYTRDHILVEGNGRIQHQVRHKPGTGEGDHGYLRRGV